MGILVGCRGPHKTPIPGERICPVCGEEVEVFTVRGRISTDSVCECGYVFRAEEQYVSPGLKKLFDEAEGARGMTSDPVRRKEKERE